MDDTTKTQEPSPAVVAVLKDFLEDMGLKESLERVLTPSMAIPEHCPHCSSRERLTMVRDGHQADCPLGLWRRMLLGAEEIANQRDSAHDLALLWVEAVANREMARPHRDSGGIEQPPITDAEAHEWLRGRDDNFEVSENYSITSGPPKRQAMLVRKHRFYTTGW